MADDRQEWFDRAKGEPAELVTASPAWAAEAAAWLTRIEGAIADPDVRLEHVGSTAVPHLPAKSVLDLMVAVRDLEDERGYRQPIEALGLVLRLREPARRFFRPAASEPRTVHVHVVQHGSSSEAALVRFRDALRSDHVIAADYAALKLRLSREVGSDRRAYNAGKSAFIEDVLRAHDLR